jgi:hypothetical protein
VNGERTVMTSCVCVLFMLYTLYSIRYTLQYTVVCFLLIIISLYEYFITIYYYSKTCCPSPYQQQQHQHLLTTTTTRRTAATSYLHIPRKQKNPSRSQVFDLNLPLLSSPGLYVNLLLSNSNEMSSFLHFRKLRLNQNIVTSLEM